MCLRRCHVALLGDRSEFSDSTKRFIRAHSAVNKETTGHRAGASDSTPAVNVDAAPGSSSSSRGEDLVVRISGKHPHVWDWVVDPLQFQATEFTGFSDEVLVWRHVVMGCGEVHERAGSVVRELEQWKRNNSVLAAESATLESLELELRKKIHAATNQHRLWLLPDLSSTTRQPVLVTVSRTNVICERFNQPDQRRVFPADQSPALLADALRQWQPSRDYLVFYVRPSGIEVFARCLAIAKSAGFQVGYDALEENREIVFSAPTSPPP